MTDCVSFPHAVAVPLRELDSASFLAVNLQPDPPAVDGGLSPGCADVEPP